MTETMKVGTKGQIVIPQRVREELGVRPGDRVSVRAEDGEVRVRRLLDLDSLVGCLGSGGLDALRSARRDEEVQDRGRADRLGR
jgi:AbrB family looped-hinge helix DNA binding protein